MEVEGRRQAARRRRRERGGAASGRAGAAGAAGRRSCLDQQAGEFEGPRRPPAAGGATPVLVLRLAALLGRRERVAALGALQALGGDGCLG
jgi:hypothetical protein